MSEYEAALLSKICTGEITHIRDFGEVELRIYRSFESKGYVHTWISGDFEVNNAAHEALRQHLARQNEFRQQESKKQAAAEAANKNEVSSHRLQWALAIFTAIVSLICAVIGK